ncbi:MAG TPA: hypothetical protein VGR61_09985 [Candidatus Dormibacteraeota bacterium]|nr:hypothetical protein [Candidatus Dormibacteraeota bacterium]
MSRPARPRGAVTELKIPAQAAYVIVAKRAAGALASAAGFGLHDVDDLNIAVAHACEKAIAAGNRMWGHGNATLKLTFALVDGGLEVEVKSLPSRSGVADEDLVRRETALEREAERMRNTTAALSHEVEVERQQRRRAELEAQRLRDARAGQPTGAGAPEGAAMTGRQLEDVAVNMIRLFVDELRYNVDARGSMRMRMVKYVAD